MKHLFFSVMTAGLLLPASLCGNDAYSRTDAFEYPNLAALRVSSTWIAISGTTFDPYNLFGAENSTQEQNNGHFAFTDFDYPDFDWVEWETSQAVPLTGYSVYLMEDVGRGAESVRFLVDTNGSGNYVLLDEFAPSYTTPYVRDRTGLAAGETRTLPQQVVARRFRMEFEREKTRFMNGIRVIEIDALTAGNAEAPTLLFTSPLSGSHFVEGEDIPVEISASDPHQIDRVELYANEEFIGQSKSPAAFTISDASRGTLFLTAKAVDTLGAESTESILVEVTENLPLITLKEARAGDGYFYFDVEGGRTGSSQVVYQSTDFNQWIPVKTNAFPGEPWTFSFPAGTGASYFRVEHVSVP